MEYGQSVAVTSSGTIGVIELQPSHDFAMAVIRWLPTQQSSLICPNALNASVRFAVRSLWESVKFKTKAFLM